MSLRRNGRIDCQDCLIHIKRRFPQEIPFWPIPAIFVAFRWDKVHHVKRRLQSHPDFRGKTWEVSCPTP